MTVTRRLSRRPITEDKLLQVVNREVVPAIQELIEEANETDHEARIVALETTAADHETRIDGLETLTVNHETRIDTLETALPTLAVETVTGTMYTLVLADAWKLKQTTNAAAVAVTVPENATVAFPIGTQIHFEQNGAGTITLSGAGGVTLNARIGLSSAGQYAGLTITKTATDRWLVTGDQA